MCDKIHFRHKLGMCFMEKKISQILMEDGFFSKELPSEFNSNSLANALEQIDVSKSKLSKQVVNKWSKLVQYSIPKKIISEELPLFHIRYIT